MAFSTILKLIVLIEILNISAVYSKVESANEPDKEFKKPDKLIKEPIKPIKEIKRLKCYTSGRDIHIECSKQFKRNSYFYVFGQSRLFWAALKLL